MGAVNLLAHSIPNNLIQPCNQFQICKATLFPVGFKKRTRSFAERSFAFSLHWLIALRSDSSKKLKNAQRQQRYQQLYQQCRTSMASGCIRCLTLDANTDSMLRCSTFDLELSSYFKDCSPGQTLPTVLLKGQYEKERLVKGIAAVAFSSVRQMHRPGR